MPETAEVKPPRTLATKLAEVTGAIERIAKNGKNSFHNYSYAMESDILSAVRSGLSERHVIIMPSAETMTWRTGGTGGDICTIRVKFSVIDGDSGEVLEFFMFGEGQDKSDKATYKAMTGAEKYALLKLFMIPTGDDPEKDEPAPRAKPQRAAPTPTAAKAPAAVPVPAAGVPVDAAAAQQRLLTSKLWGLAKAQGLDKGGFAALVKTTIGSDKPSTEWDRDEMGSIEAALNDRRAQIGVST